MALENKNDTENIHELHILQHAINHLKHSPYKAEAQEILSLINTFSDTIDIGQLRTKLIGLYHKKNKPRHKIPSLVRSGILGLYDGIDIHDDESLFYESLFSFLLLLTKYKPTNNIEDNNWVCPISFNSIDSNNRLLTITGQQYEKNALKTWLQHNKKNPTTNSPFSHEEYIYLTQRGGDSSRTYSEIPQPRSTPVKHLMLKKGYLWVKLIIEFILILPVIILAIIGVAYSIFLLAPMMDEILLAISVIAASTVIAATLALIETAFYLLEKMVGALKNCFFSSNDHGPQNIRVDATTKNFFTMLNGSHITPSVPNENIEHKPDLCTVTNPSQHIHQLFNTKPNTNEAISHTALSEVKGAPPPILNVTPTHRTPKNNFFLMNVETEAKVQSQIRKQRI